MHEIENSSIIKLNIKRLSNIFENEQNINEKLNTQNNNEKQLYKKVYNISPNELRSAYSRTLVAYYNKLCRHVLTQMVDYFPTESILSTVVTEKDQLDNFIKFIQLRGNESMGTKHDLEKEPANIEFTVLIKRIVQAVADNPNYQILLKEILEKSIIQGSLKILLKSMRKRENLSVSEMFKSGPAENNALNFYLVPEILKIIAAKYSEILLCPDTFSNLLSALLLYTVAVENEEKLRQNVYICVYKLISMLLGDNQGENWEQVAKSVLTNQILIKIFSKYLSKLHRNFVLLTYSVFIFYVDNLPRKIISDKQILTIEQKLLLEILMVYRTLGHKYKDEVEILTQ